MSDLSRPLSFGLSMGAICCHILLLKTLPPVFGMVVMLRLQACHQVSILQKLMKITVTMIMTKIIMLMTIMTMTIMTMLITMIEHGDLHSVVHGLVKVVDERCEVAVVVAAPLDHQGLMMMIHDNGDMTMIIMIMIIFKICE